MSIVTCRSHLSRGVPQLLKVRSAETLFNYVGGSTGEWRITNVVNHSGSALKPASHISITNGELTRIPAGTSWVLRGVVNNTRYVTREERFDRLIRPAIPYSDTATCAALIPIRKSHAWWKLAKADRREIVEERSRRITNGFGFIPAIARRLQYSRDLGEPFDFVTWFEYDVGDASIFDELVNVLRTSEEWNYVEREIDIRLVRDSNR